MTAWHESYVGIPYVDKGLTHGGCHCWGLVRLVLAEQAGLALPAYGDISAQQLTAIVAAFESADTENTWRSVQLSAVRALDVVRMWGTFADAQGRRCKADLHVGIITPALTVLHVEEGIDAVHVPLDHFSIAHRITGVFRHRALIDGAPA